MIKVPAKDIKPGMQVDLEGDPYADPEQDNQAFVCCYHEVSQVVREASGCVAIAFEGFDLVGFPPEHLLSVKEDPDE